MTLTAEQREHYTSNPRVMPLYQILATALETLQNCQNSDLLNPVWESRWEAVVARCAAQLPHGGGFDSYPTIDDAECKPERIVIRGSYHKMDQHGGYDVWIDYRIVVTPSFTSGINLQIVGGKADWKKKGEPSRVT